MQIILAPRQLLPQSVDKTTKSQVLLGINLQKRSLDYAREALAAALPFVEVLPAAQKYARTAFQVVGAWGIDTKTFLEETILSIQSNVK